MENGTMLSDFLIQTWNYAYPEDAQFHYPRKKYAAESIATSTTNLVMKCLFGAALPRPLFYLLLTHILHKNLSTIDSYLLL